MTGGEPRTRLRDRVPPVPPLGEDRLARIERAVLTNTDLANLRAPRRSWWNALNVATAAVAVAAIIVAIVISKRHSRSQAPTVASLPAEVVTGAGEGATLRLGDAVVHIGEESELSVQRDGDGGTLIRLQRGLVDCDVEPVPDRAPFLVEADDVTVTVVGTAFQVERRETVRVTVTRGVVNVARGGADVHVTAGEGWANGEVVAMLALGDRAADDTAPAIADDEPAGNDPSGDEPSSDEPSGDEPSSDEPSSDQHAGDRPADVEAPAVALGNHHAVAPAVDHDAPKKHDGEEAANSHAKLVGKKRPPRLSPPSGGGESFAAIMDLEGSDPAKAVRRYQEIAASKPGDVASFALYSSAYLQFFELGQTRAALATASLYERRFPRGREGESVLWLRIRAHCKANDMTSCREAAHTYLRRYPKGRNAAAARKIVDSL